MPYRCRLQSAWQWPPSSRAVFSNEWCRLFASEAKQPAAVANLQSATDRPRLYQAYRRETLGWMPQAKGSYSLPYLLHSEVQALDAVLAEGKWNSRLENRLLKSVVTLTPLHVLEALKLQEDLRIAFRFFIWSVQQRIYESEDRHACCRKFLKPCDFIIRRITHMQRFDDAWFVLKGMHKKGVSIPSEAFTVLIKSYGLASMANEALQTLYKMGDFSCKAALATVNAALSIAVKNNLVAEAEKIFHNALSEGTRLDKVTFNYLLLGLGKTGKLQQARLLLEKFAEMLQFPDRVAYTSLIAGLSKAGLMEEALIILHDMQKAGEYPDIVTYCAIMDGYCKLGKLDKAMEVFSQLGAKQCAPNVFSYSILIDGFCKEGKLETAYRLFDEMLGHCCIPTIVTYNILINGLCKAKKLKEAQDLFQDAVQKGYTPAVETYNTLISAYCDNNQLSDAFKMFHKMWQHQCPPDTVTFSSIIHGLCKVGRAKRGHNLLQRMAQKGCPPTTITYNTVLDGFCRESSLDAARNLLLEMDKEGIKKDIVTHNTYMALLLKVGNTEEAFETLQQLKANGFVPNIATFNTFLSNVSKQENLIIADAITLLELMPLNTYTIDNITTHILVQNFCTSERIDLACELLHELSQRGLSPKGAIYSPVIVSLCNCEKLELACTVLENQLAKGWMPEQVSCDRLLEKLCKTKDIAKAFQVWQRLQEVGFCLSAQTAVTLLTSFKCEGKLDVYNGMVELLRSETIH